MRVGNFKATEEETFELTNDWKVVKLLPWMNLVPCTLAFWCELDPDGSKNRLFKEEKRKPRLNILRHLL